MPHQNTESPTATAQNAVNEPQAPNDEAREQHVSTHPEAKSYAAGDYRDAALAPPAAGEVADYADDGEPLDEPFQQGGDKTNRPYRTEVMSEQGPKTRAANARIVKGRPAG
ncbi:hypothetical protein [Brevundimonas aurantiaca]|jgi:hypothetical protein|uniref:hypothetical protein n=1 Tax=Brevundimonas aurantiaca TaxID=74316 RepID=UPI001D17F45C|nr:hypothetical protein [Brevundimonas aurantiaca]MCC4292811.1 hypothetical protein [Brevundimonas aurantiaca]MEC8532947.1 hypothetical protein [Pseudomonadota bacterium]